jgi:2-polyprenyl-6-methoxyphenol hydroxylase-like FAD-dependent oxidoreductase
MDAAVIGGSLAGLMAGIELKAAGVDVEIYERSERVPDDRGAGIVMQPETLHMLTARCGLSESETGTLLEYRQYLDADGERVLHQRMPQLMTSWGLLYRALRSAFPTERYHEGIPLTEFAAEPTGVTMQFSLGSDRRTDLMIGADGSRSTVRQTLMPEIEPSYAGYVAWRGVVPESEADATLLETFENHFTFQEMPGSHILCYMIPGAEGETERGQRRLNWVWYWNVFEAELTALMTGRDGKRRDFSMPPGQVREEFLQKQNAIAHKFLSPQFRELWSATREPFLQPILDLAVPKIVHGRVALLGDAAFIPRPHTAASTSKAAANAISLGDALRHHTSIEEALIAWEPPQLALGANLLARGRSLGNRSQFPND